MERSGARLIQVSDKNSMFKNIIGSLSSEGFVQVLLCGEFSRGKNSVFRAREDQRKVIQAMSDAHKIEQLLSQT